jgi:acetolactate decarboxylase
MIRRKAIVSLLALVFLLPAAGCARRAAIYQNATIDALLDGNYDGETSVARLKRRGDFGIGTFQKLDGEMVALDGRYYQMKSDGHVVEIADEVKTPFAAVTFFSPQYKMELPSPAGYAELQKRLDAARISQGRALAIRVHGEFAQVKVRSVPAQSPPYRRLVDVVKEQSVFEYKFVTGTLVGFWFPESMRHNNVPGYHFHFITDDKAAGGHVLDLALTRGEAQLLEIRAVEIELENTPPIIRTTGDSSELNKVEK